MASKRTFNEEEEEQVNDDRDLQVHAKRRHCDPQQAEVTNLSVIIAAREVVGPIFRQVVKEEFQLIQANLQSLISSRCTSGGTSGGRPMRLCFVNSLPKKTYTFTNLRAKDGGPLQIELRNAASQQRVVTEEVATMNVQIYVLHGDFGTDGNEDWSAEEFDSQIVKPRKGNCDLLRGETVIKLERGVAFINNKIEFTDNSSATRSKMFRLGVKVVQSNNFVGTEIREAISGPVRVLDKRGKAYQKHDRPTLDGKVWRLRSIQRGGPLHKQLSKKGIKTVKDLLRLNTTGSLREKFGNTYPWDKIIEHAKDYEVDDDDERYIYHAESLSLVFNCIYEVVEVEFHGQNRGRCPLQSLTFKEKRKVERAKHLAYQNLKDLEPLPIEIAHHDVVKTLTDTQGAPYCAPDQGLPQLPLNAQQGQPLQFPDYSQPFIPNSCTNQGVHDPLPDQREMGQNSHVLNALSFEGNSGLLDGLFFPLLQGGCSMDYESLEIPLPCCSPFATFESDTGFSIGSPFATFESDTRFSIGSPFLAYFGSYSWNPKSKAVWNKIGVALKWVVLAKREAAARKVLLMLPPNLEY